MSDRKYDDPVFLSTRREALVILAVWLLAFCWVVPVCYFTGYPTAPSPDEISTTLGMPSWVAWGVALPWFVAALVSIGLCLFFIRDDELGVAPEELVDQADPAHR